MNPTKSYLPTQPVTVAAAVTLGMPEKIGWTIQSGDQSWSGCNLVEFADCLSGVATSDESLVLSVTLLISISAEGD